MNNIYQATKANGKGQWHVSTDKKPTNIASLDGRLPEFFRTSTTDTTRADSPGFDTVLDLTGQPNDYKRTKVVQFQDHLLDQHHASTPGPGQYRYSAWNPGQSKTLGIGTVTSNHDTVVRKRLLLLAKQQKFKKIETILTFLDAPALAMWLQDFRPAKNGAALQECHGMTMLHKIMEYQPPVTLVDLLIQRLSQLTDGYVPEDATDMRGRTPLHLAVYHCCDASVIQRLLDGLLSVSPAMTKDNTGRLPLHWACENPQGLKGKDWRLLSCGNRSKQSNCYNMSEIIEILLKIYPHAVTVKDCNGSTPLNLALENGANHETVLLLDQANRRLTMESSSTSMDTGNDSECEGVDIAVAFAHASGCHSLADVDDDLSSIGSRGVSRHNRIISHNGIRWKFCRLNI